MAPSTASRSTSESERLKSRDGCTVLGGDDLANNPDRLVIWPGYFDAKASRRGGRRVAKSAAVSNPDLDGLAYAARAVGIRKMKREEKTGHPARANLREGRLWVAKADALSACGCDSKEGVLTAIGEAWRAQRSDVATAEKEARKAGPKPGRKDGHATGKVFKAKGGRRRPSERRRRRK